MAPFQSPATIARLPAAKSGSRAAQSAVSTIDPMVEQIGHASAGVSVPDTTLSARAGVAARSCRAGAVKKYDAGTAASTPTTAANRIERIMIVVPLAGCRTGALGSRSTHPCLASLPLHQKAFASLISTRLTSASLVISASFRKYAVAFSG